AAAASSADEAVAEERARLTRQFSELDAALKRARLVAARADELAGRIAEQRRNAYQHALLQKTPSILSSDAWIAAQRALPHELDALGEYVRKWSVAVWDSGGVLRGTIALAVLFVLGTAGVVLWVWRQWRDKRRY